MKIKNEYIIFVFLFVLLVTKYGQCIRKNNNDLLYNHAETSIKRDRRQMIEYDDIDVGINLENAKKARRCFSQFCLPEDYNHLASPSYISENKKTENEINVNLDFDIRVFEINDIKFTVSFTMYFGVGWEEPRLLRDNASTSYDADFERVDLDLLKYLWQPNLYILNLKSYETLNVLSEFAGKLIFTNN